MPETAAAWALARTDDTTLPSSSTSNTSDGLSNPRTDDGMMTPGSLTVRP